MPAKARRKPRTTTASSWTMALHSSAFWDPQTLKETGRVTVTADGQPVEKLNELE